MVRVNKEKLLQVAPYVAVTAILLGVGAKFGLFKKSSEAQERQTGESDLNKLQTAGVQPSYLDSTYNEIAGNIEGAAMNHIFTDKDAIYQAFGKMKNDADVIKLINAFGERRPPFTLRSANLGDWLTSVLNADNIKQVNGILAGNGIKTTF